ncbi:morphogenetic protein [Klebsiella pneumoniae]|nr:morphogenetic protein [Klebsiella pneumoniae]SXJ32856.1 morphogenetic protein [Klebsiella pneumoniae]
MIFNAEMVRALLSGRKTQTRRIIKPQPEATLSGSLSGKWLSRPLNGLLLPKIEDIAIHCPFGAVGDRIWVRETWGVVSHELDEDGRIQPWTPDRPATVIHEMPFGNGYYSGHAIYAADGDFTWGDDDGYEDGRSCWKPSIHMPRAASRILLEITTVRVERLNAISEEDARAEGIIDGGCLNCGEPEPCGCANPEPDATDAFAYLWQSIYGQENWNANPWVWVIYFERIEGGAA